ncbi:MAG: hypothetical protein K6D03_11450 [Solobacterium sp.]|nr:hypothetical protein [Solobacterium sp.]
MSEKSFFKIAAAAAVLISGCSRKPSEKETDTGSPEAHIEEVVSAMTDEEKITQMLMPAFRVWKEADSTSNITELNDVLRDLLKRRHFGGVILFGENIAGEQQTRMLSEAMQRANIEGGAPAGLFIAADQEGGSVTRLSYGTQMPGNMALCASGDYLITEKCAQTIGSELAAAGINLDFAPDMDVNVNPSNPVIGIRSFSDDPEMTAEYGIRYAQGLHNAGIMTCMKHFPGHGDTAQDSHTGLPLVDKSKDELDACELIPFNRGRENADMIMTAHIVFPQIETASYISKKDGSKIFLPASLSEKMISGILRNEFHYDGVVITDSMLMDAVAVHFDPVDAAVLTVNAGSDMILMPVEINSADSAARLDEYISSVSERVKKGEISKDRLNEAVRRILKLKMKYGLFDVKDNSTGQKNISISEDHAVEWEAALKAVTLIKNDNDMLPVRSGSSVLITVPYDSQMNSAEYAVRLLKNEGIIDSAADIKVIKSSEAGSTAAQIAAEYDAVIAVSAMYSRSDIDAEGENCKIIDKLTSAMHSAGKQIAVISAQLPYDAARFTEADALAACYNARGMRIMPENGNCPAEYGPNIPAAIYTAFGGNSPTGVLPVNIMKLNSDYSYSSEIMYGRGFGLSYSGRP